MKKLALIIPFKRSAPPRSRDWSAQELAEFYRVQTSLARIGMTVSVDRGLSDEGEPWFVFCREPDGEPIIHFARIDSCYVMAGSVLGELLRGLDLRTLVAKALEREEMRRAALRGANADGTVSWHPAALVSVLVGIVYFFSTGPTEASTPRDHQAKDEARGDGGSRGGAAEKTFAAPQSDIAAQASVLSAQIGHLAAAILVAVSLETPTAPRAAVDDDLQIAAPHAWLVSAGDALHADALASVDDPAAAAVFTPDVAPPTAHDEAVAVNSPGQSKQSLDEGALYAPVATAPPVWRAEERDPIDFGDRAKTGAAPVETKPAAANPAVAVAAGDGDKEKKAPGELDGAHAHAAGVLQAAVKLPAAPDIVAIVEEKTTASAPDQAASNPQAVSWFTTLVDKDGTVIKASEDIHIVHAVDANEFKEAIFYVYSKKLVESDSYSNKMYKINIYDGAHDAAGPSEKVAVEYTDGSKIELIGHAATLHHIFEVVV